MDNTLLMQVLIPIIVLQLILLVTALVSLKKQEETRGPKWLWVLIIVFGNIIGSVIYFILGRKDR